ncbi:MAG: hypothetical protein EPO32_05930 [Anaerolineae bacterium]|nr:MAG: hypothetical protein EPO32_05930 [Anaerolineae bacterium]
MGQHKARKTRRNGLTPVQWALVAGALLLGIAAYLGFSGGGTADGTPAIAVSQEVFDFGVVKFNTPLSVQVVVTNTGDGTLRFAEQPYIEVLEGC